MKLLFVLLTALCLLGASAPESSADVVPLVEVPLEDTALVLSYARSAKEDAARLKTIMTEAYEHAAALAKTNGLLFEGDRAVEAQAIFLYALMYNESGMRPHIERCDCTKGDGDCDHGEAFGLPQIHVEHFQGHTADEVCASRKLQIELASAVLARKKAMCGTFPLTFGAYNAGSCVIPPPPPVAEGQRPIPDYVSRASRVFQVLTRRAQIDVRTRGREWVATSRGRS